MNQKSCSISPPIRGEWAIFNPPGHPKLAYDLLAVNERASPYARFSFKRHLISFISVEDTYAWSQSIYAPVSGSVIDAHDGEVDRMKICFLYDLFRLMQNKPKAENGFGAAGGNYILIKSDDFYVLLCHLKKGSLRVNVGDEVTAGDKIAVVGNSGSSIQPHLHIQVMSDPRYFPLFENLLPFSFSSGKQKKAGEWAAYQPLMLESGGHYRF